LANTNCYKSLITISHYLWAHFKFLFVVRNILIFETFEDHKTISPSFPFKYFGDKNLHVIKMQNFIMLSLIISYLALQIFILNFQSFKKIEFNLHSINLCSKIMARYSWIFQNFHCLFMIQFLSFTNNQHFYFQLFFLI